MALEAEDGDLVVDADEGAVEPEKDPTALTAASSGLKTVRPFGFGSN